MYLIYHILRQKENFFIIKSEKSLKEGINLDICLKIRVKFGKEAMGENKQARSIFSTLTHLLQKVTKVGLRWSYPFSLDCCYLWQFSMQE